MPLLARRDPSTVHTLRHGPQPRFFGNASRSCFILVCLHQHACTTAAWGQGVESIVLNFDHPSSELPGRYHHKLGKSTDGELQHLLGGGGFNPGSGRNKLMRAWLLLAMHQPMERDGEQVRGPLSAGCLHRMRVHLLFHFFNLLSPSMPVHILRNRKLSCPTQTICLNLQVPNMPRPILYHIEEAPFGAQR